MTAWTWMIYVATHNNVAGWGEKSIENIMAAELGEEVQVVIQQTTPQGTKRHFIAKGETQTTEIGDEIDSGDAGTLVEFAKWGKSIAPAERYALVLWSHGSGWEPAEISGIKLNNRSVSEPVTQDELERSASAGRYNIFFAPSMRQIVDQDKADRDIAFDNGTGHSLDTVELGEALKQIQQELEQPVDLLGMNACLMATVEIVYEVKDSADVYVASEELMPAESWPYTEILTQLAQSPQMCGAELGKLIVEEYANFFKSLAVDLTERGIDGATLTAVRVNGIEELAAKVKTLAEALVAEMDDHLGVLWDAQRNTIQFQNSHRSYHLYDLGMFCQHVAQGMGVTGSVKTAALDVIAQLENDDFILAEAHTAEADDGIMGLTTYLMAPAGNMKLSPFYGRTAYAQATGWEAFLHTYFAAVADAD